MALTIIHSPQPVPSGASGDLRDYQSLAGVQAQILAYQNGAGHTLAGATTGDLLMAGAGATLTVLSAASANQVLTSAGVGVVPAWSASPVLTSLTVGGGTAANPGVVVSTAGNGFFTDAANQVKVATNGLQRWGWDNAGNFYCTSDGSFDVGNVGQRPRDGRFARDLYTANATFLLRTTATLTNGAAAQTATLTNAPAAGNPTKWIAIDDNGTTRQIPAW
jgi:hypothetical protein